MISKKITSQTEVEVHLGNEIPRDPFGFASQVQQAQKLSNPTEKINILFNKGRYFETNPLLKRTQDYLESQGIKIQYDAAVDSWKKLEKFVHLMNSLNIYVNINIDWI